MYSINHWYPRPNQKRQKEKGDKIKNKKTKKKVKVEATNKQENKHIKDCAAGADDWISNKQTKQISQSIKLRTSFLLNSPAKNFDFFVLQLFLLLLLCSDSLSLLVSQQWVGFSTWRKQKFWFLLDWQWL